MIILFFECVMNAYCVNRSISFLRLAVMRCLATSSLTRSQRKGFFKETPSGLRKYFLNPGGALVFIE